MPSNLLPANLAIVCRLCNHRAGAHRPLNAACPRPRDQYSTRFCVNSRFEVSSPVIIREMGVSFTPHIYDARDDRYNGQPADAVVNIPRPVQWQPLGDMSHEICDALNILTNRIYKWTGQQAVKSITFDRDWAMRNGMTDGMVIHTAAGEVTIKLDSTLVERARDVTQTYNEALDRAIERASARLPVTPRPVTAESDGDGIEMRLRTFAWQIRSGQHE